MTEINKVKLLESLDSEIRYYFGLNDRNSSDVRLMLEALKTKVEKGRFDTEPSNNSSLITTIESQKEEIEKLQQRIDEGAEIVAEGIVIVEVLGKKLEQKDAQIESLQKEIDQHKKAFDKVYKAIYTQHATMNHMENTEHEKGQLSGLIQASRIVEKAFSFIQEGDNHANKPNG